MNNIVTVACFVIGLALIYLSAQRRDSLAGVTESARKEIAAKLDGEPRFSTQTLYLIGGIALVLVGGAAFVRRQTF